MFGDDGWCRGCGVPLVEQSGSLVLRRTGLASLEGAWTPNWRHDVICVGEALAVEVSKQFDVRLRDVFFPRAGLGQAKQIDIPVTTEPWYDRDELAARSFERNGSSGATCAKCGTWRWLPVVDRPEVHAPASWAGLNIVASPEWFGDGSQCLRHVLVRRGLADLIAASSPRDFVIRDANVVHHA